MKNPKNIRRKYSNTLADGPEDAPPHRNAARSGGGAGHGAAYPYELHKDFHKLLDDAHNCVKGAIEKGDDAKEAAPDDAPGEEPQGAESHVSARRPFGAPLLKWTIRLALLAAIFLLLRSSWREYAKGEAASEAGVYNDVLTPIDSSRADCEKVKGYVKYIIQKVASEGFESIAGKWAADIPPGFKSEAKLKTEMLGAGFEFGDVFADKGVIYIVECRPSFNPAKTVFFEVVRERCNGETLFRLQKIH